MAVTTRQAMVNTGFLWIAFGGVFYIVGLLWQNISNAPNWLMQVVNIGTGFLILLGLYYLTQAFVTKDKQE
jgi:drug/metabolite transporter superfamily protein YnfA